MSINIQGKNNEPAIVILPGFGSASPVMEFKPLVELIADKFKVITIEPLGYGLSDDTKDSRTLENVVNELRFGVNQLHLQKFYLMAHSLGGLYSLYWANHFPNEILGFIGIDISVSGMEKFNTYPMSIGKTAKYGTLLLKILDILGITRLASYSNLENIINIDESYPYTKEEINMIKALAIQRQNSKTLMNEGEAIDDNLEALSNIQFPKDIPVLNFISSVNVLDTPDWKYLHQIIVKEKIYSELVILQGQHYLHLDNKISIAIKLIKWILNLNNKTIQKSPITYYNEKDDILFYNKHEE